MKKEDLKINGADWETIKSLIELKKEENEVVKFFLQNEKDKKNKKSAP